jgi:hypothetical protein
MSSRFVHYAGTSIFPVLTAAGLGLLLLSACSDRAGDDTTKAAAAPAASAASAPPAPVIATNPLKEAWFGEQHLHTAYSLDAYIGGARLTPSDSYRFARGEEVEVDGVKVRLHAPLDWAAVTDHAEYIGEMYSTMTDGAKGHDNEQIKELRGLTSIDEREKWFLEYVVKSNRGTTPAHPPFFAGDETTVSGWKVILAATEAAYVPGKFTTLPAYEWSGAPTGGNLHRNVFFRDINKVPERPMSYIDINREDGLWRWLAELKTQGIESIAITHNSNASKGMMFDPNKPDGTPLDREYAELRNTYERAIEMMQIKGNSEVHRKFWAADEFANFENADSIGDYSDRTFEKYGKRNWVRYGLGKGLAYEKSLGVNPYQYGIVGGTDNHDGLMSNVAEDNFAVGSHGAADSTVDRRRTGEVGGWIKGIDLNPGSITGVWAPQNTREAIYDGLKSRETFATSGPRVKVRFFGRFGAVETPADARRLVESGYKNGVPMGGTLTGGSGAPSFTVWAMKEADGANIDRIQIVKGWVDAKGEPQDTVIDVVWSGNRKCDANGKVPAAGNTVDLKTATYRNSIGASELIGSWTDPQFDAGRGAVYYVRVLLIPTPRWSTYDAMRAGLPLLEGVAATVQERAWTSPIWYTPN